MQAAVTDATRLGGHAAPTANAVATTGAPGALEAAGSACQVTGVTLHKADALPLQLGLTKPFVRVSILDHDTGELLAQRPADRSEDSAPVGRGQTTGQNTKGCDLRARRTLAPVWEETVVCDVDFAALLQDGANATVAFEIVEAGAASSARASQGWTGGGDEGRQPASAWAFMRCRGAKGQDNTGNRARLQLFLPPGSARGRRRPPFGSRRRRAGTGKKTGTPTEEVQLLEANPTVGRWLASKAARQPIKGSIYVTVKAVASTSARARLSGATGPVGEGSGKASHRSGEGAAEVTAREERKKRQANPSWQRLEGQLCQLPSHPRFRLASGSNGCFTLAFSNDGTRLAAACCDADSYPIRV